MPADTFKPELLQQQLMGLQKLVEITCELSGQHDLETILQTVTTGACAALSCERASLYLHDAERDELYTRVATQLEIEEIRSSTSSGITGWVARRRKIANIPDPSVDARWNSAIDRRTGFHTRNMLAAPVVSAHDDRLVGVLQILNRIDGTFGDFDEQLIQAFASHAATALERAQLLEEAKQTERLRLAVEVGRKIQSSFLPSRLPEISGYELAAWWEPAEAVSGDYYDVLPLPDGRLGLVVADVSGHGVGPSLIMASVRAMLHVLARTISDPARIVSLLSETIYPDLHEGRFITLLMVALDAETNRVEYANAGHGPALHLNRQTHQFRPLTTTMLPLGVMGQPEAMPAETLELQPGDLLLLATDGAIELRDADGVMFGTPRMEELILANRRLPAPQLLDVLREAINQFHPHAHPPDDVTMMVLERKKQPEADGATRAQ